jgi:hypothetical protein
MRPLTRLPSIERLPAKSLRTGMTVVVQGKCQGSLFSD